MLVGVAAGEAIAEIGDGWGWRWDWGRVGVDLSFFLYKDEVVLLVEE